MCLIPQLLVLLTLLASGPIFKVDALLAAPRHAQEVTDYASHFNHGGELIQQMRFHDAVAEFREALRLKPDYLPAHQAIAVGYAMTQCFELSWQEVSFVRKAGAEMPEKFADALTEEISEKDAAVKRKTNERELLSAQKAAAGEPKKAAAQALLSHAFLRVGDFAAAQKEADLTLQLNPTEPEAHFVLASILGGDPPTNQQALPHLKLYLENVSRVASVFPDIAQAYWMLGDMYARMQKEAQAISAYEDGLKVDPVNAHLLNNAAWHYATASDTSVRNPQKALTYAQKAVAVTKEAKSGVLDTLGESLYANGRFDEAIAAEKKALAISPDNDLFGDQLKKFQKAKQNTASPKP